MFFNRKLKIEIDDLCIEDLRCQFDVEKSLVGYPNKANIKIFNLKSDSRTKIEKAGLKVSLYAGYEDNCPLLFSGNIINVLHKYQPPDWISELYCGDAIKSINEATINKNMPAGTTTPQLVDTLVGQMDGVSKGVMDGLRKCVNGDQSLLRGLQLSGNVKDWLKKIADD
jgi:hypothetical protein